MLPPWNSTTCPTLPLWKKDFFCLIHHKTFHYKSNRQIFFIITPFFFLPPLLLVLHLLCSSWNVFVIRLAECRTIDSLLGAHFGCKVLPKKKSVGIIYEGVKLGEYNLLLVTLRVAPSETNFARVRLSANGFLKLETSCGICRWPSGFAGIHDSWPSGHPRGPVKAPDKSQGLLHISAYRTPVIQIFPADWEPFRKINALHWISQN